MKHLPVVILLMVAALVAVVTGCRGEVRYDARLTAADSLLTTAPDSALALVTALDSASLASEGDRAYHDLLVTQARYKCYITATSDSDINRALAYNRAHDGEQEKLSLSTMTALISTRINAYGDTIDISMLPDDDYTIVIISSNNNVYVKTSGGKLMTHWSSNPTSSMRFTDLEVKNNLFRGVKSIDNLLINITNVDNRIIKTRV